jgi:hypothetical protein
MFWQDRGRTSMYSNVVIVLIPKFAQLRVRLLADQSLSW